MAGIDEAALMAHAERVVRAALEEDLGRLDARADITSVAVIPADVHFSGVIAAREPCVVAGLKFLDLPFKILDQTIEVSLEADDGARVEKGACIARLHGPARPLLAAERTALNLLQHLSGIATLTRRYVEAIEGTGAVLLDTRKTIPGLRLLQKYATRSGGARNHRLGLHDAILIKDNHVAVAGSVAEAVRRARAAGHAQVEVECDALEQVEEALEAGATRILLDNMDIPTLRAAVALIGDRAETEASGGVTLDNIRAIAETGVQYISVGSALTLSAPAIDFGLDWRAA